MFLSLSTVALYILFSLNPDDHSPSSSRRIITDGSTKRCKEQTAGSWAPARSGQQAWGRRAGSLFLVVLSSCAIPKSKVSVQRRSPCLLRNYLTLASLVLWRRYGYYGPFFHEVKKSRVYILHVDGLTWAITAAVLGSQSLLSGNSFNQRSALLPAASEAGDNEASVLK